MIPRARGTWQVLDPQPSFGRPARYLAGTLTSSIWRCRPFVIGGFLEAASLQEIKQRRALLGLSPPRSGDGLYMQILQVGRGKSTTRERLSTSF